MFLIPSSHGLRGLARAAEHEEVGRGDAVAHEEVVALR